MSENKKRKALDQLSPYSQKDEESIPIVNNEATKEIKKNDEQQPRVRRRAMANLGKLKGVVSDPEALKGILPPFKLEIPQPETNDKISGLNKCFLNAITRVIDKQSNKDLRALFKQYELYIKKIDQ